jgi:hypothetical protein
MKVENLIRLDGKKSLAAVSLRKRCDAILRRTRREG